MNNTIAFQPLDNFALDAKNPRLGREAHASDLTQDEILAAMSEWSLDELAVSFIESGFWAHEAILCIRENVGDTEKLIVVEGNRRLAALINLRNAKSGKPSSKKWERLVAEHEVPDALFEEIPYIELEDRHEVDAFLGFRHVTGIKEWAPAEKAEFITYLINERGMTYAEVMRKIGSKTETVRRNFIAFSLLKQMEQTEGVDVEKVEDRFSVLFLSLRTNGVQNFIGVNITAEPDEARTPVPPDRTENLKEYSRWLFGTEEHEPIVTDSRHVDRFAIALASDDAVKYMRSMKRPSLDTAYKLAGGEASEIVDLIETAAFNIEEALSSIHLYVDDERLQRAVKRLLSHSEQVKKTFQDI